MAVVTTSIRSMKNMYPEGTVNMSKSPVDLKLTNGELRMRE